MMGDEREEFQSNGDQIDSSVVGVQCGCLFKKIRTISDSPQDAGIFFFCPNFREVLLNSLCLVIMGEIPFGSYALCHLRVRSSLRISLTKGVQRCWMK